MMSFLSEEELAAMGFAALGTGVCLSRKAAIHGAARIAIGDNSRIDDFCVLSSGEEGIEIGRHVHIAVMASLIGLSRITVGDFTGLSARVSVYSSNDDYSGAYLTGPTVPKEFRNMFDREVKIGRHVVVGAGSVILPGAVLEDGCAVGALSLVRGHLERDTIHCGVPTKPMRPRETRFYELERTFNARRPVRDSN